MKIGKYDFTLKNIGAYIQGNYRLLIEKHGIEFLELPLYLQEQIEFRTKVANPSCKEDGFCKCNCPIPDMFYANKTCDDGCYPEMLNKSQWEDFKQDLLLIGKEDYPLPKFWLMNNKKSKGQKRLIKHNGELGTVTKGSLIAKTIMLKGDDNLEIVDIESSCPCLNITVKKDEDDYEMNVVIDTNKKKPNSEFLLILSVKWNDGLETVISFKGYNKYEL